jgi:hypothetical protein
MRRGTGLALLAVVGLGGAPVPAAAGGFELFGGYSYARSDDQSYHGGHGALSWTLKGRLGADFDLAGQYGPESLSLLSYTVGPRIALLDGETRVFVHALAGGLRSRASISIFGVTISKSETNLAVLAGGGIDRRLGGRWGLRLSGEYVGVDAEGGWESWPRVSLGASYRFGGNRK